MGGTYRATWNQYDNKYYKTNATNEELEKTADGSKTTSKRVFTYGF